MGSVYFEQQPEDFSTVFGLQHSGPQEQSLQVHVPSLQQSGPQHVEAARFPKSFLKRFMVVSLV
jgi:hypothetical protein